MLALSISSVYIFPLLSRGGMTELEVAEITFLSMDHQSLDESLLDFSLLKIPS